jgi:hypothetical protein
MIKGPNPPSIQNLTPEMMETYFHELAKFDAAVCEASAVSLAVSARVELPTITLATHVFTRMSAHGTAAITAAPGSRWSMKVREIWDVSVIATHARALLEGCILFHYLANAPADLDIQGVYAKTIFIYDCKKKISFFRDILPPEATTLHETQLNELTSEIQSIPYFQGLNDKLKKQILNGDHLMIVDRAEVINEIGIDRRVYDRMWGSLSQYSHIFSFTLIGIKENGRGTGPMNAFDVSALKDVLGFTTSILSRSIYKMVQLFPDIKPAQQGINSKFTPGPQWNRPLG